MLLIQATRRRQGLSLFAMNADGSPGTEFSIDLGLWRNILREVPNDFLEESYTKAAEDWNFANQYKQFPPDLIRDAYREIVIEARKLRGDSMASYRMASKCHHTWEFEPEDKDSISGDFYLGFNVCKKCRRIQPVSNPNLPAKQKGYFKALTSPPDEKRIRLTSLPFDDNEDGILF